MDYTYIKNATETQTNDFKTATLSYAQEIHSLSEIRATDNLYEHHVVLYLNDESKQIGVNVYCRKTEHIN